MLMASSLIGDLSVDLRLNSNKFTQGAKQAQNKLGGLRKSTLDLNKAMGGLLAFAGAASFTGLVKSSLDAANHLGDLEKRLGVTVEGMSRLQYAAQLTGVSSRTLETGLQRMTRRVAEAANGSGEAVKALDELGLSASKLAKLSPEKQFHVLADALNGVENPADKVRLAMKLLDSEGVALIQTMDGGSEALRKMGAESDRVGATISKSMADGATDANEALNRLKASGASLGNSLAVNLGPTIAEVANWLTNNLPDAVGMTKKAFTLMAAGSLKAIGYLVEGLRAVTYPLGKLNDQAKDFDKTLFDIQENMKGAGDSLLEELAGKEVKAKLKFEVERPSNVVNIDDFRLGDGEQIKDKKAEEKLKKEQEIAEKLSAKKAEIDAKEDARMAERREMQIEGLHAFAATEQELLAAQHEAKQEQADNFYLQGQIKYSEFLNISKKLQDRHLKDIFRAGYFHEQKSLKFAQLTGKQKLKVAEHTARGLLSGLSSSSKTAAKITKAFAIKDAIVNTYKGVSQSLAAYPMPIAAGFAAAHLAAGLANVKNIRSESSGGSLSTPSVPLTLPVVENPNANSDIPSIENLNVPLGESLEDQRNSASVVIQIDGDGSLSRSQLRELAEQVNELEGSNVRISA